LPGIELIVVERAAGDLRAGYPVVITSSGASVLALSAETMHCDLVAGILGRTGAGPPYLLLTPERAHALKIRLYTPKVLAVPLEPRTESIFALRDLADPANDLSNPLRGPFFARREPSPGAAESALRIMKIANLLPAAIGWFLDKGAGSKIARDLGLLSIPAAQIDGYEQRAAGALQLIAKANLPLAGATNTRILAFRPQSGAREHLALLIGNPEPDAAPLVRIHSECFTGDLLGSLKCDCGDQLRGAIARMGTDSAGGILLYLAQEGRGIGLINKLRAYDLQDQGFDTVDANTRLGFEPDERQFSVAVEILRRLGFSSIRLLTNNPEKVAALNQRGIAVSERVPHSFPSNPHNVDYLKVKARKSGHLL
jgi:GTP cyclohydrolase II